MHIPLVKVLKKHTGMSPTEMKGNGWRVINVYLDAIRNLFI